MYEKGHKLQYKTTHGANITPPPQLSTIALQMNLDPSSWAKHLDQVQRKISPFNLSDCFGGKFHPESRVRKPASCERHPSLLQTACIPQLPILIRFKDPHLSPPFAT